jgi:molybdenum cofactor biosynthesis protein MoaC
MRDVSQKVSTLRTAVARATIKVSPETIVKIRTNTLPKGNPLEVARVAAVQAAKNTSQIIPYCHPLPVDYVGVEFHLDEDFIEIETIVKAIYKTGVEMEALTAASVAALTIYDMAKMVDDLMEIESITLVSKTGGKSDYLSSNEENKPELRAAVVVLSDSVSQGKAEDKSGKLIEAALKENQYIVEHFIVLPDSETDIVPSLRKLCDDEHLDLIITTGGTGVSPRDNTPEALNRLIEKELPGISEAIRSYGQDRNSFAMLSRSVSGLRGKTVIVSLPGSTGGVSDGLQVLFPALTHAFKMLDGKPHKAGHKVLEHHEHNRS